MRQSKFDDAREAASRKNVLVPARGFVGRRTTEAR
jgi:hypothetical protein